MKSRFIISLLILLVFSICHGQSGNIITVSNSSKILKREISYSIYLPPSYGKSVRSYPVVYLLHGIWGDNTDWVNRGEVTTIANAAFASGKAPEMIVVIPDGLVDAFYQNSFDKSVMWEDYFIRELMPDVESKYRIYKNRNYRAIAGLSMGGYGSVYHALKYKELFSYCYAMSGAFLEIEPVKNGEKAEGFFEDVYVKVWGNRTADGYHQNYKANSLQEMIKSMDQYTPPTDWGSPAIMPEFTLDCGDDDFLFQNNIDLVTLMKAKKLPVEFRVRDGGHTWDYWRSGLALAFEAIGKKFRG